MDLSRYHNGSESEFYKSLGALEAKVTDHDKRLDEINTKLDSLLETSNKMKGGWTLLTVLVSAAVFLGTFMHDILNFLRRIIV